MRQFSYPDPDPDFGFGDPNPESLFCQCCGSIGYLFIENGPGSRLLMTYIGKFYS
jgi:hypothetical protein